MATLPDRVKGRRLAAASLWPQVDWLTVVDGTALGDAAKFDPLDYAPTDAVFLTADDDLVYPPDYVERILAGLDRHPGAIVSFHGWRIGPNRRIVEHHPCLKPCDRDYPVDVAGTGVMAFRVGDLHAPLSFPTKNNADLHVALHARRHGIPLIALEHPADFLGYTPPPSTIWDETYKRTGGPLDASAAKEELIDELIALVYP